MPLILCAARTFYSYDLYLDNELGLEVKDDAISITEFKAKNKNMLVFLPKQRKSQNLVKYNNRGHNSSTYEVVGSWGPFSTPFCTQLCKKKLVLSILEGVKENLEDGSCFDQFDEKDLVVRPSGKITKTQKDMILLKLPYHDKWRILAKQNAVLEETVNFRYDQNGCTNYEPLPKFNEKGLP
uniref:Uncharacterized protein n=1 Tax=Leersia perrieri TaxID=77586 RepID=A0A0D9XZX0_9ORYZ